MVLFGIFLALVLLGLPVAFSFVVGGLFYQSLFTSVNPNLIASTTYGGIDSFSLLAIPFFIFAGDIMLKGGVSKRLVDFAKLFFKDSVSAFGTICVVACAFFGAISGSAAAAVAAIGGLMVPEMIRNGYKREYATAVASASGYLGILIPPSVPIVLYCVTAGESIGKMFISGVIPGLLATAAFVVLNSLVVRGWLNTPEDIEKEGIQPAQENQKTPLETVVSVIPGLVMPFIILGGTYSGIFTPTEAAAVAIIYGAVVSIFIYRELKFSDLPGIAVGSAMTAGKILVIVAFASYFGKLLTLLQIPAQISRAILGVSDNKWIVLLLIVVLLLIMGMLMDMSVSIILMVPIMLPIATSLGFESTHFGMIVIFCLAIGLITPPMALNLFVGCQIAECPMSRVIRPIMPFVLTSVLVLLLIIFIPGISTWLPALLGYQ